MIWKFHLWHFQGRYQGALLATRLQAAKFIINAAGCKFHDASSSYHCPIFCHTTSLFLRSWSLACGCIGWLGNEWKWQHTPQQGSKTMGWRGEKPVATKARESLQTAQTTGELELNLSNLPIRGSYLLWFRKVVQQMQQFQSGHQWLTGKGRLS